jgi:altered-inheritance-of-mitochondria protein 5
MARLAGFVRSTSLLLFFLPARLMYIQVGGAVLTSATIYLAVAEIRNRTHYNSHTLRESRERLEALRKPATIPENSKPYIARPSLIETMKDRWNDELEGIWRWAQSLDSVRIREGLEEKTGNIVRNLQK